MKVEFNTVIASRLFKSVGGALGKDKTKSHLSGLQWKRVDGVHVFTATDAYRCHIVTLDGEFLEIDPTSAGVESVLVSGDIVAAVATCSKVAGKTGRVSLESSGDGVRNTVTVSALDSDGEQLSTVKVSCLEGVEFPNIDLVLGQITDSETLPAFFDGNFLSAVIEAATVWQQVGKWSNGQVCFETIHSRKPSKITSVNDAGTFTGIVMPQRVNK